MNRRGPEFASVTISFFVHATEDEPRLIELVSRELGVPQSEMQIEPLKGHYGNALTSVRAHVIGRAAGEISKYILTTLDVETKRALSREIDRNMDEHEALYIRLDRQLLSRRFTLGYDEPIRIKLKPKNRFGERGTVRETYRELLGKS